VGRARRDSCAAEPPIRDPNLGRGGRFGAGYAPGVVGAIIFVVVMVAIVPVAIMFGGAIWSALFGWVVSDDADSRAGTTPTG
jgi:hypothetical protein